MRCMHYQKPHIPKIPLHKLPVSSSPQNSCILQRPITLTHSTTPPMGLRRRSYRRRAAASWPWPPPEHTPEAEPQTPTSPFPRKIPPFHLHAGMVAAVPGPAKAAARPDPARRLPLTPSEKDNAAGPRRRPRAAREATSRYLSCVSSSSSSSSSSSAATPARRCPSPMVARASPDLPPQKRAQSAERRRHSVSGPASDSRAPAKALWASTATTTRSLSVSFQGESFSLPVKKPAPTPAPSPAAERRRGSPVRGKTGEGQSPRKSENSRLLLEHQHRWPARLRSSSLLTRSLDHSAAEKIGALANPIRPDSGADASTSDTESVSSGSNSESTTGIVSRSVARGLVVPARFWQETNSRLRRLHDSLPSPAKKAFSDSPRRQPSPLKATPRPASPSRFSTFSPRGSQSPSRPRPPASGGNAPSLLSFAADVRRGKMGGARVVQAHALRLLHNRHLQWRFGNARVNAALAIQCQTGEVSVNLFVAMILFVCWVLLTGVGVVLLGLSETFIHFMASNSRIEGAGCEEKNPVGVTEIEPEANLNSFGTGNIHLTRSFCELVSFFAFILRLWKKQFALIYKTLWSQSAAYLFVFCSFMKPILSPVNYSNYPTLQHVVKTRTLGLTSWKLFRWLIVGLLGALHCQFLLSSSFVMSLELLVFVSFSLL